MSNVQVKNLEPGVHDQLRSRAAAAGLTISDYVLELIQRDLRKPGRQQWLSAIAAQRHHEFSRSDITSAIDDGRTER